VLQGVAVCCKYSSTCKICTCVAVCYRVLQGVARCYRALQCVAVCCKNLSTRKIYTCVAVCTAIHVEVRCSVCCSVLQCMLQGVAGCCIMLQYVVKIGAPAKCVLVM